MSYSRRPGPVIDAPDVGRAGPAGPTSGVAEPGPVGMKGGGGKCGGSPRMRGWPRAIKWSEFEEIAERPADEEENARIHAVAELSEKVDVCREDGKLRLAGFTVNLKVLKEDSWVVTGKQSGELLNHEQGHYDLAGLKAKELMNKLAALRADDLEELQELVNQALEDSRVSSQELSDLYDDDTDHGRKPDRQAKWDEAIRQAIDSGGEFKEPN
jgi:hypothetical protein